MRNSSATNSTSTNSTTVASESNVPIDTKSIGIGVLSGIAVAISVFRIFYFLKTRGPKNKDRDTMMSFAPRPLEISRPIPVDENKGDSSSIRIAFDTPTNTHSIKELA